MLPYNKKHINTAQIAFMLSVSRAYATDRLTKRNDFPKPVINHSRRLRRLDIDEAKDFMVKNSKLRSNPANLS